MTRAELAAALAAGLAGWHQLQSVQRLGNHSGEDTARSIISQIINAQGRFAPATSQLPRNWGSSKKRIDVALLGRTQGAALWYGAIEVKWPGDSFDPHQVRMGIVQDAMRLAFIETANLNAKFVVLGGETNSLEILFDKTHEAEERESRRVSFEHLFSRDAADPARFLEHASWLAAFPDAGGRIPQGVFEAFDGRLKTELLARATSTVGGEGVGSVFVWQCNRTRGTAQADVGT